MFWMAYLLPYEAGIRAQAVMKDDTHSVRHIHPGVGLWQAARSWLARFLSGVLSAGGSQRVLEFFRLCRLCRYPGAAGEL